METPPKHSKPYQNTPNHQNHYQTTIKTASHIIQIVFCPSYTLTTLSNLKQYRYWSVRNILAQ